jgi:predicted RecA/RadA family phage recombinase
LAPGSSSCAPGALFVIGRSLAKNCVTLHDGNAIPVVGLGVFEAPPAETDQAAGAALRAGHRHIDTVAAYRNGRETGPAVAESGVPRDQLYVVTTLWNADQGYDSTLAAFPPVQGLFKACSRPAWIGSGSTVSTLITGRCPRGTRSWTPARRSPAGALGAGSARSG